jgi:hypothetical protein
MTGGNKMTKTLEKHVVAPENAAMLKLETRGGIAIWGSVDLSNPGASWSTPRLNKDGKPSEKPTWQAGNEPIRIITDPAEIEVHVPKEVKRFKIATRMGSQGLSIKLTDVSSAKLRKAVAKLGDDAWYEFDYDTREAVIYLPDAKVPLMEWKEDHG